MITGHELALADAVLARFGVTADQFVLMAAIAEGDGLTQQDLVRRLSSDASTVRAMLLLLEERGMIRRPAHPSDGRARCVSLTPRGKRALQTMIEASHSIRTRILEALGPDRVDSLKSLLACVTEAMVTFPELQSNGISQKPAGSAREVPVKKPAEEARK
jgi:DNA-binding MarR family transcriptional regulator